MAARKKTVSEAFAEPGTQPEEIRQRVALETDIVSLRFRYSYQAYNQGEVAGFQLRFARTLVEAGTATPATKEAADMLGVAMEAPVVVTQSDYDEFKINRLTKIIELMDSENKDQWTRDGKPSINYLTQQYGEPVSNEERDAAWSRMEFQEVSDDEEDAG